ncbi:LOW QUALITY PROTEIN: protein ROOT HAIR SPECIFIC 17 [Prosopis cineraria]|uniref:LOW QUALITY PROTEIN: protein ROOT HAIR SPECIFIC 17 n=1 Tax=Prosopis cineraria TaxID=364024 RepID=UPI00240FA911|nr:LOW QUALITY PROTEIN: protein ROOT HAIR SPECIFIC 17 [Prosopis cineraria]
MTREQNEVKNHCQSRGWTSCSFISVLATELYYRIIPSLSPTAMTLYSMKRKKQHADKLTILGLLITNFLRRHYLHRILVSAVSACLLLLFATFSLLAPSPVHHLSPFNDKVGPPLNSHRELVFHVPANGGSLGRDIWSSTHSRLYYGCSNASDRFLNANTKTHPNRYLLIATSGGLNQQRTGITDAVVAAYLLNATLVTPMLDQQSFWKDTSNFAEIFDVDWFISFLRDDVRIIKQLSNEGRKSVIPYSIRVPRKCTPECYEDRVLPHLVKRHVVQLTKFDYRLSNRLDADLQKLRCRVNYHALKFTKSILGIGRLLVERMRMKSKHFVALHLRYEPDMLAFSGCYYGGGERERRELGAIRKRWKSLQASNPDKVRRHGRCPLNPEEVGLMLRALGFGSDVQVYVASGDVYGGEETLAPLKALFPNLHSKETILNKEELAPFAPFSSRMAAIDFIVCEESDVFVTNNNGNMAKMLAGRRRYFGHKPTIRPNAKKLYRLFMNKSIMTWEEFASRVRTHQVGLMGEPNELKPGMGEFHENPSSCICQDVEAKAGEVPYPRNQTRDSLEGSKMDNKNADIGDMTEKQFSEEEKEWSFLNAEYLDS